MAIIFNGKKLAQEKEEQLKFKIKSLKKPPKLVAILVGEDPASRIYLRKKAAAAKRVGIEFEEKDFPAEVEPERIIDFIRQSNADPLVDGVMIQLPLPKSLEIRNAREAGFLRNTKLEIVGSIDPSKDVDCLTPENFGLLAMGKPVFLPATVKAILKIIKSSKLKAFDPSSGRGFQSSNIVIVGASNIVGKPLAIHLSNLGGTVVICRSKTKNLADYTRRADLLISATGVSGLIKKEMVKKGAVVIDVGSPIGEVDFKNVAQIASFITPVPGGVGPLTVVCLLENLLQAARRDGKI